MKIKINNQVYTPQRVFCIGRNYAEHARELRSELPQSPVVFMKPPDCLVPPGKRIPFPAHGKELHFEAELVVVIGLSGMPVNEEDAREWVAGLTLGLDLTLRDVQQELKEKGLPWELSKAFEQSAPLGDTAIIPPHTLEDLSFECRVNGEIRQTGRVQEMIFSIPRLICELGKIWVWRPGDLIYTGTPAGVGPLAPGDVIEVSGPLLGSFSWSMTDW